LKHHLETEKRTSGREETDSLRKEGSGVRSSIRGKEKRMENMGVRKIEIGQLETRKRAALFP